MARFTYNNIKNTSIGHIFFELNCRFYPQVLFKEDIDSHSKSHLVNKLADKLKELIKNCYQNLFYI